MSNKFYLYGYVCDGGDGSASIQWTTDPNFLDEHDDYTACNEGSFGEILVFESEEAARECGLRWE